MKKMLLLIGLFVLSVLVVGCTQGTLAGEATKLTGTRIQGAERICPSGCDLERRISTLEGTVIELKAQLEELRGETRLVRSEDYTRCLAEQTGCGTESISLTPFGGCPRGVTASACNPDGSLRCSGEGEFYVDGPVDICTMSRNCIGEAPYARCDAVAPVRGTGT